jgi:hypothetical protein
MASPLAQPRCFRPGLRTDIRNAGGKWVDEEVVVDESVGARA